MLREKNDFRLSTTKIPQVVSESLSAYKFHAQRTETVSLPGNRDKSIFAQRPDPQSETGISPPSKVK